MPFLLRKIFTFHCFHLIYLHFECRRLTYFSQSICERSFQVILRFICGYQVKQAWDQQRRRSAPKCVSTADSDARSDMGAFFLCGANTEDECQQKGNLNPGFCYANCLHRRYSRRAYEQGFGLDRVRWGERFSSLVLPELLAAPSHVASLTQRVECSVLGRYSDCMEEGDYRRISTGSRRCQIIDGSGMYLCLEDKAKINRCNLAFAPTC